jgi:hypothetical protein
MVPSGPPQVAASTHIESSLLLLSSGWAGFFERGF